MHKVFKTYTSKVTSEIDSKQIREILKESVEMVRKLISVETVKHLLFTRKGGLYASFPSKKVREWALKKQREYGLPHNEENIVAQPLLYEALRAIYKELEFDLGKNYNLGWIITARFGVKYGLEAILEKKTNLRYYELDYGKEIEEATGKILKYCQRIAQEVLKELTGGISLGALRWYEAFGHPESITILESNGKEIKKRQEISFK